MNISCFFRSITGRAGGVRASCRDRCMGRRHSSPRPVGEYVAVVVVVGCTGVGRTCPRTLVRSVVVGRNSVAGCADYRGQTPPVAAAGCNFQIGWRRRQDCSVRSGPCRSRADRKCLPFRRSAAVAAGSSPDWNRRTGFALSLRNDWRSAMRLDCGFRKRYFALLASVDAQTAALLSRLRRQLECRTSLRMRDWKRRAGYNGSHS